MERRTPLARGTSELKRTPLKQGKGLERRTELKQGEKGLSRGAGLARGAGPERKPMGRRPTRANVSAPERTANRAALSPDVVPFRAKRPLEGLTCVRCRRRGASAWHHWFPQSAIRELVFVMRLPTAVAQRRLRALLADERNLEPMCWRCHEAGEHTVSGAFSRAEVPESAGVFAMELDDELEAAGRPREAVERLLREWR